MQSIMGVTRRYERDIHMYFLVRIFYRTNSSFKMAGLNRSSRAGFNRPLTTGRVSASAAICVYRSESSILDARGCERYLLGIPISEEQSSRVASRCW